MSIWTHLLALITLVAQASIGASTLASIQPTTAPSTQPTTAPSTQAVVVPPVLPTVRGFHQAVVDGDGPTIAGHLRSDTPASVQWRDGLLVYYVAKSKLARVADAKLGGMRKLVLDDEYFLLEHLDRVEPTFVPPLMILHLPGGRGTLVLRWMKGHWLLDPEAAASLGQMTPEQVQQEQSRLRDLGARYDKLCERVEAGDFTSANAFLRAFNDATRH